ncbi:MAG: type transport system permease protein [Actinomycetota bacterium]|jgi:ABC-2 type transport system permease protein|nr:type transport system permease protein [Actinomycetota bacterium]
MNRTVALLTVRTLLGRRRAWLLLALPAVLLLLSVVIRLTVGSDEDVTVGLLGAFALATVVPLLGLIAGTGAIGAEIDDGSIVYLLSKPLSRQTIVTTKLAVAVAVIAGFAAVPVLVAGFVLSGAADRLAVAYALGALIAGVAYCALFLMVAVLTRNAVVIGLLYALVWESLVGSFVPGAQALSIQQWSLSVTRAVVGPAAEGLGVTSAVRPAVAVPLLVLLVVGATLAAGRRLRSLRLTGDE